MLSLLGGLVGVFAGVGGSFILGSVLGWPMTIPLEGLIVAPLFAIVVGIFFGFYPAWRATQLDPIAALRRE